MKPRHACAALAVIALLTASVATRAQSLDGAEIEAQFVSEGLKGRLSIGITELELEQTFTNPGGIRLTFSARHRVQAPISLQALAVDGAPACSIDAISTQLSQTRNVAAAVVPIGPGTIFRMAGKVQLLGNTITAAENDPLVFVVHAVAGARTVKPELIAEPKLVPVRFRLEDASPGRGGLARENVLQLVHIGGKGSAVLLDGKKLTFR